MNRRWYRNIDWSIVLVSAALVGIGLVGIYSSTHGPASEFLLQSVQRNFHRQLVWSGVCVGLFAAVLLIPARALERSAYAVYAVCLVLLIGTLLFGRVVNAAKAWLYIGGFGLQTGEVAKVGALLAVARFLSSPTARAGRLSYALGVVALLAAPAAIIVLQNDTGTALVYLALVPFVLFWGGLRLSYMALLVAPAVAGYLAIYEHDAEAPLLVLIFGLLFTAGMLILTRERWLGAAAAVLSAGVGVGAWVELTRFLQPHQIDRIVAFTKPEAYRLTAGFHVIQSKAAIGSGGLTGKGFMQGTQTQLAYIPEQSTDFIFTVIGEEWGFIGAMLVLVLFAYLLIRLGVLGSAAGYPFARITITGVAGMFLVHVLINIGMTIGVMPVIGIPLPLVSYGGSAMLANTMLVALAVNLSARRDEFSIYRA